MEPEPADEPEPEVETEPEPADEPEPEPEPHGGDLEVDELDAGPSPPAAPREEFGDPEEHFVADNDAAPDTTTDQPRDTDD